MIVYTMVNAYMITLTYPNGMSDEMIAKIQNYIDKLQVPSYVVVETGKHGLKHVHAYVELPNPRNTDSITKSVRSKIYTKEDLIAAGAKQHLVRTSKAEWLTCYNYLTKEETAYLILEKDVDVQAAKKYKETIPKKVNFLKGKHMCNKFTFPYEYIDYCNKNNLFTVDFRENVYLMMNDGYVIHHLFNILSNLKIAVRCLTEDNGDALKLLNI